MSSRYKSETFNTEPASALETLISDAEGIPSDPDQVQLPTEEDCLIVVGVQLRPGKKRGRESRVVRLANAAAHGSAIREELDTWLHNAREWVEKVRAVYPEENVEEMTNHLEAVEIAVKAVQSKIDEADEIYSTIEEAVGSLEGVEIPGMYG
jgi:hypothetical protein